MPATQDMENQAQAGNVGKETDALLPNSDEQHSAKASTAGVVFSLVTCAIGIGIVALPKAMAKGGWIGGCACLGLSAIFNCQCGKMLVSALEIAEKLKGRQFASMDEAMEACTDSPRLGFAMKVMFEGTLVAVGAVLLILLGQNMTYVAPFFSLRLWIMAIMAILLPLGYLCNMKYISDLAGVGVVCAFGTGLFVFIAGVSHVSVEGYSEPKVPLIHEAPSSERSLYPQSILDLGGTFCLFVFSFCFAILLPSLRRDMEKPEEMPKAINTACGIMLLIYGCVGIAGYTAWGSLVGGSVVDSIRWCSADAEGKFPASIKVLGSWACYSSPDCSSPGFLDDIEGCNAHGMCSWIHDEYGGGCAQSFYSHSSAIGTSIAVMLIVNALITYLLILSPVFKAYEREATNALWKPSVFRTAVMLVTFASACLVPYFAEVVGIVSALTHVALQLLCPVIMLRGISTIAKRDMLLSTSIWHFIILIFSALAAILGLYGSFCGLVAKLREDFGSN
jgi:hypothetical protein